MSRSFGLVDYKVQEAEFFLNEIIQREVGFNFASVQYLTSAFASASRSITFAMQASLKGDPKFDNWYEIKQKELRNNKLARFFHDFRTVTNHIGENVVGGGTHQNGKNLFFFTPCRDLPVVPETDVVTTCKEYFAAILSLVFECYLHMGPIINGQLYFTEEHFQQCGKTIEDAEEELGFPRGWTDIGKPELIQQRWHLLRRRADSCLINEQFNKWLGKKLPIPPSPLDLTQ